MLAVVRHGRLSLSGTSRCRQTTAYPKVDEASYGPVAARATSQALTAVPTPRNVRGRINGTTLREETSSRVAPALVYGSC
jgi:hypothetical protein